MTFIPVREIKFNKKGKKFAGHLLKFILMVNKKKNKPVKLYLSLIP